MIKTTDSKISRRRFLGAMAATPIISSANFRGRKPSTEKPKVAVIGAGAFGGWTALQLNRLGAEVILVDSWGPGNSRSSLGGEGRAIRAIYGPDRIYTEMVKRSLELWKSLEIGSGARVYRETGAIWMMHGDDSYVQTALPILAALDFPVESLSTSEAALRYPQIDFDGIDSVYLERHAGVLLARESCQRVVEQFSSEGGSYRRATVVPQSTSDGVGDVLRLEDGTTLQADQYVFACGSWLGKLFPDLLSKSVLPTRQEVYYFGTPKGSDDWSPEKLPVWVEFGDKIVYGFPDSLGRGFKIADDTRGEPIDPTTAQRTPTPELIEAVRSFLRRRFPTLAGAPLIEARVCQYENSPDGDLILDRHPEAANVWIAGGGSGHGFKLAPAVGEQVAEAILQDRPLDPKFSIARLPAIERTSTQVDFQEGSE
jgi:sarcosine oxidase